MARRSAWPLHSQIAPLVPGRYKLKGKVPHVVSLSRLAGCGRAGAQSVAAQYPQYAAQITAAAKSAFLAGDTYAYLAGIIAVLIGGALVFFFFPKKDEERKLLLQYHEHDSAAAEGAK